MIELSYRFKDRFSGSPGHLSYKNEDWTLWCLLKFREPKYIRLINPFGSIKRSMSRINFARTILKDQKEKEQKEKKRKQELGKKLRDLQKLASSHICRGHEDFDSYKNVIQKILLELD
jgi:hypothetical protein